MLRRGSGQAPDAENLRLATRVSGPGFELETRDSELNRAMKLCVSAVNTLPIGNPDEPDN